MASTDLKLSLKKIYQSALKAIDPEQAVKAFLSRNKNTLIANNRPYCIKDRRGNRVRTVDRAEAINRYSGKSVVENNGNKPST